MGTRWILQSTERTVELYYISVSRILKIATPSSFHFLDTMKITLLILSSLCLLVQSDDIDCLTRISSVETECRATTTAGIFGTCPGGYKTDNQVVKGQPPGTFCVRLCTAEETSDCNNANCQDYTRACRQGTPVSCDLAVKYCAGVVSDHVCNLAPHYRKCEYTNKCQEFDASCCPPNEAKATFAFEVFGVAGVQGQPPKTLYTTICGVDNGVSLNTLRTEYAAHGAKSERRGQGSCSRATEYVAFNRTLSAPRDLDAVVAQNEAICESNGGAFNTTVKAGNVELRNTSIKDQVLIHPNIG